MSTFDRDKLSKSIYIALKKRHLKVDDVKTLLSGLKLVGDYLDKTILKPNNLNYPKKMVYNQIEYFYKK